MKENRHMPVSRDGSDKPEMTRNDPVYSPATDIYEKDDAVLVLCDMPGVDEKDVEVTLEDGVLSINGRQSLPEPEQAELLYRGFQPGLFHREFSVTSEIAHDKIVARLTHGVLNITLPKAEAAKPRRITVQTGV